MVRFASLFDAKERTVTFLSGKKYSVDDLHSMGAGDLLNSMFEFSEKLNALQLSDEEMSLFTAVVLVSAGKERKLTLAPLPNIECDSLLKVFCRMYTLLFHVEVQLSRF